MPQIIVETNIMIMDNEMWRTGCILKHDNSKALISTYSNRIFIFVLGDNRKKRELLIIIRSIIDRINAKSSYKTKRLVPLPDLDNKYADYQVLLNIEKNGEEKFYFDKYLETEKPFLITELLEDIPRDKEVTEIRGLLETILKGVEDIKGGVDELKIILTKIELEFKNISEQNQKIVINELINFMKIAFKANNSALHDVLEQKFKEHKEKDNFEFKIKASMPLLKELTGISIEAKFDIKKWAMRMYEKHKLKIFELFGYL